MVLSRIVLAALLVSGLGACKLSLFADHGGGDDVTGDANGSGSDGGGDGSVPASCGAGCIADATADFGMASKWQYFDDHRNRTWAPMTSSQSGSAFVGANAENKFMLVSGKLLVSTAGMTDASDPAIQFTSTEDRYIKLSFTVDIPATASSHTVRLYRNSREDVLFTKIGLGGDHVETSISVDAFTGDRFLLALAPTGSGGSALEVKFFVNETTTEFPANCQVGLQFSTSTGHTVPNECRSSDVWTFWHHDGGNSFTGMDPMLSPSGPYSELGMAASIPPDHLFSGPSPLDRTGDTTTQFWIQMRTLDSTYDAILYSDEDCETAIGGLMVFRSAATGMIGIESCTSTTSSVTDQAAYPAGNGWHFIRVVHTGGNVNLCVDGGNVATYALPAGGMATAYLPELGMNNDYSPVFAKLDALMDDVRVFSTALPCE